jgi:hypothetical protein
MFLLLHLHTTKLWSSFASSGTVFCFKDRSQIPGTDVMLFKNIFAEKFSGKNWRFLTQNKAKIRKMLITTLVFEKNAN